MKIISSTFAALVLLLATSTLLGQTFTSHIDLPYAGNTNPRQMLDIHVPNNQSAPTPLIVWIHGGGWQNGNKTLGQNSFQLRYARNGYAVASLNYRLSSEAIFPAQAHDTKAAIRWLRANAATYNIDPTRIGVWGSSAGGHLAALLGTSNDVVDLEGTLGVTTQSSRVQAVVDWFGPTDFLLMDTQGQAQGCGPGGHNQATSPESLLVGCQIQTCPTAVQRANPMTYYTRDDPPFFIQHGSVDCAVPNAQSGILNSLMTANNHDVVFQTLVGAGHGGPQFSAEANLLIVDAFWAAKLRDTVNPLISSVRTFYKSVDVQSLRAGSLGRFYRFEITGVNTLAVAKAFVNGVERNVEIAGDDKVRIYGFPGRVPATGEVTIQLKTAAGRFSNVIRTPILSNN